MNKIESLSITLILLIISIFSSAQVAVGQWQDHLSYNKGKQVMVVEKIVYLLSESGILKYDKETGEIEKLTKLNVLSDVTPTRMAFDEETGYLIIGYTNGNIDLIKNDEVININDIKQKSINSSKSINSIYTKDGLAYLGCDFGIVVLNLKRLEIGSTWFVGQNGSYVHINAIECNGDDMYLATTQGVFKGNLNDALVDFSKWEILTDIDTASQLGWMNGANYNTLKYFQGRLLVNYKSTQTGSDKIMAYDGNDWTHVMPERTFANTLSGNNDTLLCSTGIALFMYNSNLEMIKESWWYYTQGMAYDVHANDACISKGKVWVADGINGLASLESWWGEIIKINSPSSNNVFDIASAKSRLLAVRGGYTSAYVPTWTKPTIYKYENYEWLTETSDEITELEGITDFVYLTIDPNDENHYFISSWAKGLVEFRNDEVYKKYTDENSTLQKIDGSDMIRVGGGAFDNEGNFWVANSLSSKCLHVMNPSGEWIGFTFPDMKKNIRKLIVTQDGIKWLILGQSGGIFIFDDNGTPEDTSDDQYKHINILNEDGEVVSNDVYSIAEDQNGYVWVGTAKGVVVYYKPEKVFETANVYGRQIKVPRNDGTDLADLLLSTDVVTAICVDGGNYKWFGTQNGGVYYTNPEGTEILQHFSTQNSGLPSDNVLAMSIVPETGEIFIGTQKGIVSYRGTATEGSEDYEDIYAFPNPVKSDYEGPVSITGLIAGSIVKITDIAGNLVFEAKSKGGQVVWDGKNLNGNKVASGVYVVFASTEIGEQTATTKILFLK